MAPRAYWKGSLKLSLVSCPVALYPATTSVEKTHFHMINRETGHRLKQQMVDTETGEVVEGDQKARGYELKKGEYVEVEKQELDAVQIESSHTIDIDGFVPEDEIDKRYLNHPYYIVPDGKAGVAACAVIPDAITNKERPQQNPAGPGAGQSGSFQHGSNDELHGEEGTPLDGPPPQGQLKFGSGLGQEARHARA